MKLKYSIDKDTFTIKGMKLEHLQVIMACVEYVRLGNGLYENAAFELVKMFKDFLEDLELQEEDCQVSFSDDEGNILDDVTINLSHVTD